MHESRSEKDKNTPPQLLGSRNKYKHLSYLALAEANGQQEKVLAVTTT